MQERLLQFIWQHLLFDTAALCGTEGERIQILESGTINSHAGPDMHNARIRIDGTLWAGNVEIHLRSGMWHEHGHTRDKSYDGTILHVCWEHTRDVFRTDGSRITTLTLREGVNPALLNFFQELLLADREIPCSNRVSALPRVVWDLWLDRLAVERLCHKADIIFDQLAHNGNHWLDLFYLHFVRNFGYKVNTIPFEQLARMLPLKLLLLYRDKPLATRALLLGVAGFLGEDGEDPDNLRDTYNFLKTKHGLQEMDPSTWKHLRLFPAGFPKTRVVQLAGYVGFFPEMFTRLMECASAKSMEVMLSPGSENATSHKFVDLPSPGLTLVRSLILNTVLPFQFARGCRYRDDDLKQRALDILQSLPAEQNSTINLWAKLGVKAKNSLHSQALLQLKNEYCDKKRCLDCHIGHNLLTYANP